jgi:hypothetical protein
MVQQAYGYLTFVQAASLWRVYLRNRECKAVSRVSRCFSLAVRTVALAQVINRPIQILLALIYSHHSSVAVEPPEVLCCNHLKTFTPSNV